MITEEYTRKHPRSNQLYQESLRAFPGGVTHDTRYVMPFPVYMTHAKGPRKWDVDGNEYVGYVMGHGALLLGHNHPEVVKAVKKQLDRGTHLGANTQQEIAWAHAVKRLVGSVERIRFHSSGTEATLMAIRLARAYTGRTKILKFERHFHGWHDYVLWTEGAYHSIGIPKKTVETTVTLPPGNIAVVEKQLKKDRDIAAVILEPTGASMGKYPIMPDFLTQLRELTERYNVLLIFDEVVTGFRISSGGAQQRFGVRPDLTTFAKILGGGLPGGAVGGRADILEMMSFATQNGGERRERVPHPGTYNANPLSATAGSRCLEIIASEPINERADAAASELRSGFNGILKKAGVSGVAYGLNSLVRVLFGVAYEGDTEFCSLPHDQVTRGLAAPQAAAFKRAMLNAGVDAMSGNLFIVSAVHGRKEVEHTFTAFEKVVNQMKSEGLL